MPQLIQSNSVLPSTLKVPIMPGVLMPGNIIHKEPVIPCIIPTSTNAAAVMTPPQSQQIQAKTTAANANVQQQQQQQYTLRENVGNMATLTHKTTTQIPNPGTTTVTTMMTTSIPTIGTPTPTTNTTANGNSNNTTSTAISLTTPTPTTTITTTLTKTPTLTVRHSNQAPKSPPRWPLRPGVMVHVSSDTKENLAVNRMTLKPNATLANLTGSTVNDSSVSSSTTLNNSAGNGTQTTLLNVTGGNGSRTATLGRMGNRQGRMMVGKTQPEVEVIASTNNNNNNNTESNHAHEGEGCGESPSNDTKIMMGAGISTDLSTELHNMENVTSNQARATNSPEDGVTEIQRLTAGTETEIRVAAEQQTSPSQPADNKILARKSHLQRVEQFFVNIFFKRRSTAPNTCRDSQRSHVGLLGGKFWKRSEAASPFAAEHRLKGIRSSGSVTYKKCAKTTASNTSTTNTISTTTATTMSSRSLESHSTTTTNHTNTTTNLITTTPVITTAISQQQIPQPQTLTPQHPQSPQVVRTQPQPQPQPQQQHLRPLPVSMISTGPSLNTNHPVIYADPKNVRNTSSATTNVKRTAAVVINTTNSNSTTNVTPSTALNRPGNTPADTISLNSSTRSTRKGILKAPTPPPRPPPPIRRVVVSHRESQAQPQQARPLAKRLVQRSVSLVCPGPKTERVQIKNHFICKLAMKISENQKKNALKSQLLEKCKKSG
uniref:Uncharacterized protein n=1 Tax=Musca domestica TaxID=7370 RepID=A0A1I8N5A3_MUSDO